jgi:hypothetical protein
VEALVPVLLDRVGGSAKGGSSSFTGSCVASTLPRMRGTTTSSSVCATIRATLRKLDSRTTTSRFRPSRAMVVSTMACPVPDVDTTACASASKRLRVSRRRCADGLRAARHTKFCMNSVCW